MLIFYVNNYYKLLFNANSVFTLMLTLVSKREIFLFGLHIYVAALCDIFSAYIQGDNYIRILFSEVTNLIRIELNSNPFLLS